jgi:hypothetical protein
MQNCKTSRMIVRNHQRYLRESPSGPSLFEHWPHIMRMQEALHLATGAPLQVYVREFPGARQ